MSRRVALFLTLGLLAAANRARPFHAPLKTKAEPSVRPEQLHHHKASSSMLASAATEFKRTQAQHRTSAADVGRGNASAGIPPTIPLEDYLAAQAAMRGEASPKSYPLQARNGWQEPAGLPAIAEDAHMVRVLEALGGGTGVRVGGLRHTALDRELVRRMRIQDKAVAMSIVAMYFVILCFTASIKYHECCNDSPVLYYADPRYHNLVTEGEDEESFLEAFNQPPKCAHIQVTGFHAVPDGHGSVQWRGDSYRVAFTFALDLSPWVVREQTAAALDARLPPEELQDGIPGEDHSRLREFLATDANDLAMVDMQKEVVWPGNEELATNIKQRIRQKGFTGVIGINLAESETVTVFKNQAWANFMHSRTVKVLVILSIVGWVFYFPYMWLRCRSTKIRSRFRVDVAIADYWPLIAHKLTATGFDQS